MLTFDRVSILVIACRWNFYSHTRYFWFVFWGLFSEVNEDWISAQICIKKIKFELLNCYLICLLICAEYFLMSDIVLIPLSWFKKNTSMINFSVEFSKALKNKMYVLILNMHHNVWLCMYVYLHFAFILEMTLAFWSYLLMRFVLVFFFVYYMNLKTLFQVK